MKKLALILCMPLLLTACAIAPKQEPIPVCPKPPAMELDAPERDWQGQMQNFLRGSLGTPPSSKPPSTNAGQGIKPPKGTSEK